MLLLWTTVFLLAESRVLGLCAPSRALNYPKSPFYSYPISVYLDGFEGADVTNATAQRCYGTDDRGVKSEFLCASVQNPGPCPVTKEFVLSGLHHQREWVGSKVLCNLREALHNPVTSGSDATHVNVFVFGGSFTAGVSTAGCCKEPSCNTEIFSQATPSCRWMSYLARWLSSFGTPVKIHNLAIPGYNANTFNDVLVSELDKIHKNYRFTKNDLILLDLSVNDANTFVNSYSILERGLEGLLRRFYALSVPESMPTVVLLEMWPWEEFQNYKMYAVEIPYTKVYANVARHYNISLWSFRDSLRELYVGQQHTKMMEYLGSMHNYQRSKLHLSWHQHLFYADFISAAMMEQFHECTKDPSHQMHPNATYPLFKTVKELPAPIHSEKFERCDSKKPTLLQVTSEQVVQHWADSAGVPRDGLKVNIADLGSGKHGMMLTPQVSLYASNPPTGWTVWEDKAGRPGFIHEFSGSSRTPASLQFRLNITHAEFVKRTDSVILQVQYLRTYANAGMVRILLCGNPIKKSVGVWFELDALWADYANYKYSMPQLYPIPLENRLCSEAQRKDKGSEFVTVEFLTLAAQNDVAARGKQKFKLFEVTACSLEIDEV